MLEKTPESPLDSNEIKPVNLAAAAAKSLQSCLTLCDPIDSSPPGPVVPGILQARVLEWVATGVGCHFLLQCMKVKSENEVAQSCLTLRDPMDGSLPGSSVHGIFQTRALEWGAIAFSKSILREINPEYSLEGLMLILMPSIWGI